MDQADNSNEQLSGHAKPLASKSWTAYVGLVGQALLILLLAAGLGFGLTPIAALVILLPGLAYIFYCLFEINSYRLYYDDVGVWLYSGILPWKKGVSGVKWRDLDEATCEKNFLSWLFNSYSIRIGHRFTKANEIFLTHMAHGDDSVQAINAQHKELVRQHHLD